MSRVRDKQNVLIDKIELYNSLGDLIYSEKPKASGMIETKIDVSGFAKGIYFLKIISADNERLKKVVID